MWKASDEKITTVSADREFFDWLLIITNARQVNFKELMTHHDGSLRKTNKIQLVDILEKNV